MTEATNVSVAPGGNDLGERIKARAERAKASQERRAMEAPPNSEKLQAMTLEERQFEREKRRARSPMIRAGRDQLKRERLGLEGKQP